MYSSHWPAKFFLCTFHSVQLYSSVLCELRMRLYVIRMFAKLSSNLIITWSTTIHPTCLGLLHWGLYFRVEGALYTMHQLRYIFGPNEVLVALFLYLFIYYCSSWPRLDFSQSRSLNYHSPTQPQLQYELELALIMGRNPPTV